MSASTGRRTLARIVAVGLALLLGPGSQAANGPAPAEQWLAQAARPIGPAATDLAAFGAAVGDRPIVGLGELSHGDAAVFELKLRLVQYLHEQKGFDLLIVESGLYDVSRIWALAQGGNSVAAQGPGNIFFMYSKSREGQRLLHYVDSAHGTLLLAGLDAQHSGGLALDELPKTLAALLQQRHSAVPADPGWTDYLSLVRRLVGFDRTPPEPARRAGFFALSDRLEGEFCAAQPDALVFPDSPGWWGRILRSLRAQASDFWDGTSLRDTAMAENVQWLLDHPYQGRKAILWAHSAHLNRDGFASAALSPNMGRVLDPVLGTRLYDVGFTVFDGTHLDFTDLKPAPVPDARPDSVEAMLHRLGPPLLFVDLTTPETPRAALGKLPSRFVDYRYFDSPPFTYSPLTAGIDGLFYVETARPTTMLPESGH
jgi:erythromycin esterase